MPRPRTPLSKTPVEGRVSREPGRYQGQSEPKGLGPVGSPPASIIPQQKQIWAVSAHEVPGTNSSHRALMELATILRARLISERDCPVNVLTLLRLCLNEMGATPASASKVSMLDESEDPDEALFRRTH